MVASGGTGSGASGGAGGAGGSGNPTGGAGGSGASGGMTSCVTPAAPRAPLRRITRFEYNNTVRDLLGVTSRPADALPGEELGSGFGNDADVLSVSRQLIDGYRLVAQQIAADATATAAGVVGVTKCDPATDGEDACRQKFIPEYLSRAFRRPADAEDIAAYDTAFTQGKMLGGTFATGVKAVVERSL